MLFRHLHTIFFTSLPEIFFNLENRNNCFTRSFHAFSFESEFAGGRAFARGPLFSKKKKKRGKKKKKRKKEKNVFCFFFCFPIGFQLLHRSLIFFSFFFSFPFFFLFLRTTGPARTRALQRTPTRRKRRKTAL